MSSNFTCPAKQTDLSQRESKRFFLNGALNVKRIIVSCSPKAAIQIFLSMNRRKSSELRRTSAKRLQGVMDRNVGL